MIIFKTDRILSFIFQAWLYSSHLQSIGEKCSPSILMPTTTAASRANICDTWSGQRHWEHNCNQTKDAESNTNKQFQSSCLWGRILSRMAAEQYSLKWTNYQRNVTSSFKTLLENEEFVDVCSWVRNWFFYHRSTFNRICQVTISAEGKSCSAHRVVLSAASPYFRNLLSSLKVLILEKFWKLIALPSPS